MLLGLCLLLGLAIAALVGVDLWRALDLRLRHTWTVWSALAIQLVIFSPLAARLPSSATVPLHIGSYALIGAFLAVNLRVRGMPLVALGWLANTAAIVLNGGRMPISLRSWELSGRAARAIATTGIDNNNVLARHARLPWLGDIFPVPARVPFASAFSIGDVLIVAGALTVVSLAGVQRTRPAGVLAPLRSPRFVTLVGARGISQLGDWITTTAAVAWLYAHTGATWTVSCYLIARIGASLAGGLVGHRLVDRYGRQRFAHLFACRGALTGVALACIAVGATLPAFALLVLSAAAAPITNSGSAALTPATVPDALLQRANALSGFVLEVAVVAGAAIGGITEAHLGLAVPLGVDVVTFVLAAIAFFGDAIQPPAAANPAEVGTDSLGFVRLARRLMGDASARPLVLSFAIATAAVGMVNASLPRFMAHLHAAGGYGIAIAAVSGGAMLGGILVGSMNESRAVRRSVPLGFAGMAVSVMLLADIAAPATACLILVLVGIFDATTEVSYATILQRAFPGAQLAALMTVATAFISAGMMVGYAAAALTNAAVGAGAALFAAAGVGALAALFGLPLARLRPSPGRAEALAATLARPLLRLPTLLETTNGRTVAVVAEDEGRWLAYPADAITTESDLRVPGYEIGVRRAADADHCGVWIEITNVVRMRHAA